MERELNEFLQFVLSSFCSCVETQCYITGIDSKSKFIKAFLDRFIQNNGNSDVCNVLHLSNKANSVYQTFPSPPDSSANLIDKLNLQSLKYLDLFYKWGFLTTDKSKNHFLFNSYKRYTWHNVITMTTEDLQEFIDESESNLATIMELFLVMRSEEVSKSEFLEFSLLQIKFLFWYLRKCIVDDFVQQFLLYKHFDVTSVSVGSTSLTSDYDITLYGNFEDIASTISYFNIFTKQIFNSAPSDVFDTNIYGVSFITIVNDGMLSPQARPFYSDRVANECNKSFRYIKDDGSYQHSQHVWAFLKLIVSLQKAFSGGTDLFDTYISYINSKLNNKIHFKTALNLFYFLSPNSKTRDSDLILLLNETLTQTDPYSSDNSLNKVTNIISLINYFSIETYYTRGAFFDVVVNGQLCKNTPSSLKIPLDQHTILDSFIENTSDFIVHFTKSKYLSRLSSLFSSAEFAEHFGQVPPFISSLVHGTKICKVESSNKLISCDFFDIINKCIDAVIGMYNKWNEQYFIPHTVKPDLQFILDLMSEESVLVKSSQLVKSKSYYNIGALTE